MEEEFKKQRYVQPVAKRLSITKKIGGHTSAGQNQEPIRHANTGVTMDLYAQALPPAKRAGHLEGG